MNPAKAAMSAWEEAAEMATEQLRAMGKQAVAPVGDDLAGMDPHDGARVRARKPVRLNEDDGVGRPEAEDPVLMERREGMALDHDHLVAATPGKRMRIEDHGLAHAVSPAQRLVAETMPEVALQAGAVAQTVEMSGPGPVRLDRNQALAKTVGPRPLPRQPQGEESDQGRHEPFGGESAPRANVRPIPSRRGSRRRKQPAPAPDLTVRAGDPGHEFASLSSLSVQWQTTRQGAVTVL
jgi:hypothetical protein